MRHGKEVPTSLSLMSCLCITTWYPIYVEVKAMAKVPMVIKRPPRPSTKAYLTGLFMTVMKAILAD